MSATPTLHDESTPEQAGTLGELLSYNGAPRISEAAWLNLVQAIAGKDPAAMRALYDQLHRLVFTLALRIVGQRAAAEEVTVDAFHEVWRRAPAYEPANGTVVGWVMNLARSRAIDRVRFEQRQKRLPKTDVAGDPEDEAADLSELAACRHEDAARVRHALQTLTSDERAAIEIAYFSDASHAEVARRLDVPLGTIKGRIKAGLAKLRFALTRETAR